MAQAAPDDGRSAKLSVLSPTSPLAASSGTDDAAYEEVCLRFDRFVLLSFLQALALKSQGNDAFTAKEYEKALELFTQAIELCRTDYTFYSNRYRCTKQ